MKCKSKLISIGICSFLIELRLVLQTCSTLFLLFLLATCSSFLITYCLLHIHRTCPIRLNSIDDNLQVLLTFRATCKIFHIFPFIYRHSSLGIYLFLGSTLLYKSQGLPQPIDLSYAIMVISRIVIMSQSILVLRCSDQK